MQPDLQGLESQLEATKLVQTKPDGPKSQIEGPELETKFQEEDGGTHSKAKELVLARYVRRQYAPNQIIRDKLDGTMVRRKLKGTCLLAGFEPRSVKDALEN